MINRVVLVGRITRDPEVQQTNSGASYVRFSVAVNRPFKDNNGERQADFINCIAWRNQADFIRNYVKKGNLISLEGRIQTGSYQNNSGQTVYTTEVLVDSVSNLEPRQDNNGPRPQDFNNNNNNYNNNNNNYNNNNQSNQDFGNQGFDVTDDDLPF